MYKPSEKRVAYSGKSSPVGPPFFWIMVWAEQEGVLIGCFLEARTCSVQKNIFLVNLDAVVFLEGIV